MPEIYTATKKLNSGIEVPFVGLGTWQSEPEKVTNAVEHALKAGYRHIDAAWIYKNEKEVGEGIRRSGVPRKEIHVTTKLWNTFHKDAQKGLEESLSNLGLDYIDLYLIHWPVPNDKDGNVHKDWDFIKTWHEMQKLDKSKVRSIGVSNFSVPFLEKLLKDPATTTTPAVNQVEIHPLLPQHELQEFCEKHGIAMTAYSPFGSSGSPNLSNEGIVGIAKRLNVSAGQVIISWLVSRGIIVIPKSVTPHRIDENIVKIPKLTDDDIKLVNDISKKEGIHRYCTPKFGLDIGWEDYNVETGKQK